MAVVLRMRRTGRKNLPCFRIIATDSRFPRDGRQLETLGLYDPLRKDPAVQVQIDLERVKHWISVGAVPSPIVASILRKRGITAGVKKRPDRKGRSAKTKRRATKDATQAARTKAKAARLFESRKRRRVAKKATAAAGGEKKGS
jgi:small subunit ribosomal protein S16